MLILFSHCFTVYRYLLIGYRDAGCVICKNSNNMCAVCNINCIFVLPLQQVEISSDTIVTAFVIGPQSIPWRYRHRFRRVPINVSIIIG